MHFVRAFDGHHMNRVCGDGTASAAATVAIQLGSWKWSKVAIRMHENGANMGSIEARI